MEFRVYRASDYSRSFEIREFNTLEELLAFSKEVKSELLIGGHLGNDPERTSILIYDDYIE